MRHLIYSAAVAAGVVLASVTPSLAVTYNPLPIQLFGSPTGDFSTPYYIDVTAATDDVTISGGGVGITSFTVSGVPITVTVSPAGPGFTFLGNGIITPGDYTVTITGDVPADSSGALYFGNISGTPAVAPTPLPSSTWMALGGLMLLGFWGWRARRNANPFVA